MNLFVSRYRIPGGVGMNHSICCVAGIFPWGPTKTGQIFLANDKTSFIVKTPVQAIVGFLGAVFMLQGIHVITFDGGIPLCILTD